MTLDQINKEHEQAVQANAIGLWNDLAKGITLVALLVSFYFIFSIFLVDMV